MSLANRPPFDRRAFDEAITENLRRNLPGTEIAWKDPAPMTPTSLSAAIKALDAAIKSFDYFAHPVRHTAGLDPEENTMTQKNLLTDKKVKRTREWQGRAGLLAHDDLGRLVHFTRRDGVEVKDIVTGFILSPAKIFVSTQHSGTHYVDPESKVVTWSLNPPEEDE